MSIPFTVRPMRVSDAAAVLDIYQAGLDTGDASFELTAPTWAEFDAARLSDHRMVIVDGAGSAGLSADSAGAGSAGFSAGSAGAGSAGGAELLGWIAASAVSARPVYAGVIEHSLYVAADARGRGVGAALLDALIASTERAGVWTIQSGVFPENTASLALHARAGFRVVGVRERLGRYRGEWRDVLLIERRSTVVH